MSDNNLNIEFNQKIHLTFEEMQELFAIDVDLEDSIRFFVNIIIRRIKASRACIVFFGSQGNDEAFCHKDDNCRNCSGNADIVAFAKRLCDMGCGALFGTELTEKMRPEEAAIFGMKNPAFVPVKCKDEIYGILTCDKIGDLPWDEASRSGLNEIVQMLGVIFRNAFFFENHQNQQSVFLRMLENLDANIYVTDMETDEILFMNKKMRGEFGLKENPKGQICWKLLQDGFTERCSFCPNHYLQHNINEKYTWEEHNTVTGKYYLNTDSIIEWIDGSPAHFQHSVDITREKNASKSLEEAKELAEKANKSKSDFLSRMSHEIRTPINAVIGMTRIAKSSDDLTKTKQFLEKIDLSSQQLLGIINDILDMSKIDANKMVFVSERFSVEKMLSKIASIITVRSAEKHQKLNICMDLDMPRFYMGDEFRITQVITNLLSNAIKFTPENGRISLYISELSHAGDDAVIEVKVTDTGIGIAPQYIDTVFSSFEQGDGGIARKFGGTGLGLAISKSIVESLGGEISVSSVEGEGSTFTFTVHATRIEGEEGSGSLRVPFGIEDYRVLIIDDEKESRVYFEKMMTEFRIAYESAQSSGEARKKIDKAKSENKPFDILFVSNEMICLDGRTLLESVKDDCENIIVILNEEMKEAEAATDGQKKYKYVTKPFFPSELLDAIVEVAGIERQTKKVARRKTYSYKGYSVLLVEDVEINREIFYADLIDTGLEISFAENGRIAVELFEKDPRKYDMIFMDVHMPEMDGHEATRRIRQMNLPRAKTVPIVAMTANVFVEDVEACLKSGMNDHLAKPIDLNALYDKLNYYLIEFVEPEAKPEDLPPPVEKEAVDLEAIKQYIDYEDALKRVRGNKTIYKTLLKSFVTNSYLNQLGTEIKGDDRTAAANSAHMLKGISANLSLTKVNALVVLLEAQLKSGFNCTGTFEELKTVVTETIDSINKLIDTF